ncbi:MAG TPA: DUF3341 domain-containing protein [Gemmatimonadales bacterium]|nr:DUF3341 domain-containing protein [Gemmatimonadales bacterium]
MSPPEGLAAELASPEALAEAARRLRGEGYRLIEAVSPLPLEGVEERLQLPPSRLGKLAFAGGVVGGLLGYGVQWYGDVRAFPVLVGGRPLHAVPAFVPVTFEATILGAALTAFVGVLIALRLPQLWHPTFEIEGIGRASADRYWVTVDRRDPLFDPERTRSDLVGLHPIRVVAIPGRAA